MNMWKKTVSSLLVVGMMTTGLVGLAYADTTAADEKQPPAMGQHRGGFGGNMFSTTALTEKISGLSADTQAEILALAAQLEAYQPAKEKDGEVFAEQDENREMMNTIMEQIKAIFDAEGVTLELAQPEKRASEPAENRLDNGPAPAERPEMAEATARPERPEQSDQSEQPAPPENAEAAEPPTGSPFTAAIEEAMTQLSSDGQAEVNALLAELETLMPEKIEKGMAGEKPELTEEQQTAMAEVEAIRQQLMEALTAAGITLEMPERLEKPADQQ